MKLKLSQVLAILVCFIAVDALGSISSELLNEKRGKSCETYQCFFDNFEAKLDTHARINRSIEEDGMPFDLTYVVDLRFFDTKKNDLFGEGKLFSNYFYSAELVDIVVNLPERIVNRDMFEEWMEDYLKLYEKGYDEFLSHDFLVMNEYREVLSPLVGGSLDEKEIDSIINDMTREEEEDLLTDFFFVRVFSHHSKEEELLARGFHCYVSDQRLLSESDLNEDLLENQMEAFRGKISNSGLIPTCYGKSKDPFSNPDLVLSFGADSEKETAYVSIENIIEPVPTVDVEVMEVEKLTPNDEEINARSSAAKESALPASGTSFFLVLIVGLISLLAVILFRKNSKL